MKLMHLGDLHLGRSLNEYDLSEDQEYILDQLLKLCRDKKVDAVLIAGDVYDKSIPSEKATTLLDGFLNQLVKERIPVFMISGNHDSDDRLNFGSRLFKANNIYIDSVFSGKMAVHTLEDAYGPVDLYALPFVKASQVRQFYPKAKIETYEDAVRTVIEAAQVDKSRRNIILAHQFVAGRGCDPALGGSEGLAVKSVGLVEKIGYDTFDSFDYVALGHIHAPQSVGRDTVRYAGSPLKYDLSEAEHVKSVPIVTLGEKGSVEIELVPLKPKRDLRHIRGPMKSLLDPKHVVDTDDYIYATLTDEDPVDDVMGIFRLTYPNMVRIDYDNAYTREMEQVDLSGMAENRSFEDLIRDFYRMVYGCEITEEEMAVMQETAREAGVLHETD